MEDLIIKNDEFYEDKYSSITTGMVKETAKNIIIDIRNRKPMTLGFKQADEKIIKNIEACVRTSNLYRKYVDFLKNTLKLENCSFYKGYSIQNNLSIEFHHHPLTLYDITEICYNYIRSKVPKGSKVDEFDIAKEVMLIHFCNLVGICPLNPTAHELVHSGELMIHSSIVKGGYLRFIEIYKKFIPPYVEDKLTRYFELCKKENSDQFPEILTKKPVILERDDDFEKSIKGFVQKFNLESIIEEKMKNLDKI